MTKRPDPPPIWCLDVETPGTRVDCPNAIHDYPLPDGYGSAHDVAMRRLRRGWMNPECPDCGLHDWRPGERALDPIKDCIAPNHQGVVMSSRPVYSPIQIAEATERAERASDTPRVACEVCLIEMTAAQYVHDTGRGWSGRHTFQRPEFNEGLVASCTGRFYLVNAAEEVGTDGD